jgi:hypothetical protein
MTAPLDATDGPAMTVGRLRELLAHVPAEVEVLVNADDVHGGSVFAALKSVSYEPTCNDEEMILRLMADDTEDAPQ